MVRDFGCFVVPAREQEPAATNIATDPWSRPGMTTFGILPKRPRTSYHLRGGASLGSHAIVGHLV
jgi:hypothetical protein